MSSNRYVSRINQLDVLQLDHEIDRIILSRVAEIFQFFMPKVIQKFSPELNAVLRATMGIFSLSENKSTFGQKLLDLTYANLTQQKTVLFLLFSILPKYLKDKYLDDTRINEQKYISEYLEKIMNVMRILNFINLLIFLNQAKHSTILDRTLGIVNSNTINNKTRTIGYSYMTRELLWHGLMELFTTGIPAINFHSLKQYLVKPRINQHTDIRSSVIPQLKIDTICPYCKESPVLPFHCGCKHIYCYYCLQAHFTASNSFQCLICATELQSCNKKMYVM